MALDLMMGVKTTKNLTLDFTDLPAVTGQIPTDYHGYSVTQGAPNSSVYVLNALTYQFQSSGYVHAAASVNHTLVGYNAFANFPLEIQKTNHGLFTFTGMSFESAWNSSETVRFTGYRNGVAVPGDVVTVTVDDVHLTNLKVNWTNVDDVKVTLVGTTVHDASMPGLGDHLAIASIGVSV